MGTFLRFVPKRPKFLAGFLSGAILFGGSAFAASTYVSDNTPENGYLLCANIKTKAVTFPAKLNCPSGTRALDLGAVSKQEGPAGPQGQQGPAGPVGPVGISSEKGYLIWMKAQDVVPNANELAVRTVLSKSGFTPGFYSINGEVGITFSASLVQSAFCQLKVTGNSVADSLIPSFEVSKYLTSDSLKLSGLLIVLSPADVVTVTCTFSGNAKVPVGYLMLSPVNGPTILTTD